MQISSYLYRVMLLLSLIAGVNSVAAAQQQDMQDHSHHMPGAAAAGSPTPGQLAKLEADKRFSEFNHRMAGLFVLLAGLLTLLEPHLAKRFPFVRYLWFLFFLIPGMYLFILSDDESWPVGPQSLMYVITSNPQVLQHKMFALILLALGVVEFMRVRNKLQAIWAVFLFPALAATGAVLLLFHPHAAPAGAMSAELHRSMQTVHSQHLGFAAVGFGIALSKAGVDLGRFHPQLLRYVFAGLMVALGGLLLAYTE